MIEAVPLEPLVTIAKLRFASAVSRSATTVRRSSVAPELIETVASHTGTSLAGSTSISTVAADESTVPSLALKVKLGPVALVPLL